MKKKIVLMKNVKLEFESIADDINGDFSYYEKGGEYVILSEVIEVEFPELDNKTVINNQVAIIDDQITKVRADAEAAITALDGRKNELLSITYKAEQP